MPDWRENFAGMNYPHAPGESFGSGGFAEILQAMQDMETLKEKMGPAAFTTLEAARTQPSGGQAGDNPNAFSAVQEALGRGGQTQNELAGIQRFGEGERLAKQHNPIIASLLNAGYEGDKWLGQKLGMTEGPVSKAFGIGGGEFNPSTSDASLGNVLATQMGIYNQTLPPKIMEILRGMMGEGAEQPATNENVDPWMIGYEKPSVTERALSDQATPQGVPAEEALKSNIGWLHSKLPHPDQ